MPMKWNEILGGVVGGVVTAAAIWLLSALFGLIVQFPVPKRSVIAFNQDACPSGWRVLENARGRYVVGVNAKGGIVGATQGIALDNLENRPAGRHSHAISATFVGGEPGDIQWDARHGSAVRRQVTTTETSEGREGTPAPYIQLLMCEKE